MRPPCDAQLRAAIEQLPQMQVRSLWVHADNIAQYLALTGAYGPALTIWRFLFEHFPLPAPETISIHFRVAPEAFCRLNAKATPDFVGGESPGESLATRVSRSARRARRDMNLDRWSPHPSFQSEGLRLVREARALARPPKGARFSPTELEALPVFQAFFAQAIDDPRQSQGLHEAYLTVADILYRHERKDEAIHYLKLWGALQQKSPYIEWYVFALPGLAWLLTQKHLEFLTDIPFDERRQLGQQTVRALQERLRAGTPHRSQARSIEFPIFYSQFMLEPATEQALPEGIFWKEAQGALPAPDVPYPTVVSVGTPSETGSGLFHLHFADEMPDWGESVYAATFPFRARENSRRGELGAKVGNVFVNSPTLSPDDIGFEVPPGDYDVAALFHRTRGAEESEAVGLRHFDIHLYFLPRGTCSAWGVHFDRSWEDEGEM